MKKRIFCMRFRVGELTRLDELAERVGVPSRSRLVNLAVESLLASPALHELDLGRKRSVNILLDERLAEKLNEAANKLDAPRTELVRLALRRFTEQSQMNLQHGNREY